MGEGREPQKPGCRLGGQGEDLGQEKPRPLWALSRR